MLDSQNSFIPQQNFISGFLHKELPAFTPIILFNMQQKGKAWINSFETILENLLQYLKQEKDVTELNLKQQEKDVTELIQHFLDYEKLFYETVIDKGFKIAFDTPDESEIKTVCINTIIEIVRKALCIGDEKWTQTEKLNSEYLRYYKKENDDFGIVLPKDDCIDAETRMWDYIQEPSNVTRDGKEVTDKRLLTFKRTGNHQLLISLMIDTNTKRKSWLSRVIERIGNSIPKYHENADVKTDIIDEIKDTNSDETGNTEALNAKIAKAREIAERSFYVKADIASNWAYYTAQMKIMSEARTKQYEVWLLRLGFPQMFMGQKDSGEDQENTSEKKERGINIDDTSAILACLSHDTQWQKGKREIDMDGTLVWANPDVWTHRLPRKRPSFTDHQDKALVSISKLNSLFLNRFDGEMPGWTCESRDYFAQLLHSEDTLNENSTDRLAVAFRKFFEDDENKEPTFMDILTGNITQEQENELDNFLYEYELRSITDLLDVYFKQSSDHAFTKMNCLFCHNVSDVPGLSETTKEKLFL